MKIYETDLDTFDKGLETQLILEAQVKFAIATNHTHLIDCNDRLFEITVEDDEITITEVDTEHDDDCEEPVDPIEDIIDSILRNSLLSSEPIRKEQAETMLILAHLKATLATE